MKEEYIKRYYKEIKRDLPKFPDEIIDAWILDFAKDIGWPPGNPMLDPEKRWGAILRSKDLEYWAKIKWQKEKQTLAPKDFVYEDQKSITGLILTNVFGVPNIYSLTMSDTKERFDRICEYMKTNGSFPGTVAIVDIENKYLIADGCHRLAAYFYLLGYLKGTTPEMICLNVTEEQEYWVGRSEIEKDNSAE